MSGEKQKSTSRLTRVPANEVFNAATFGDGCAMAAALGIPSEASRAAANQKRSDGGSLFVSALLSSGTDAEAALCVHVLAFHGGDAVAPWRGGDTPLHLAAERNLCLCIGELLALGADLERCCDMGRRAVHFTALRASSEALQALADAGADVHALDAEGRTIVEYAQECRSIWDKERFDVYIGLASSLLERSELSKGVPVSQAGQGKRLPL